MINDMIDEDRLQEFLDKIADKYTATEICEILGLTEWDLLEQFREFVMEKKDSFEL